MDGDCRARAAAAAAAVDAHECSDALLINNRCNSDWSFLFLLPLYSLLSLSLSIPHHTYLSLYIFHSVLHRSNSGVYIIGVVRSQFQSRPVIASYSQSQLLSGETKNLLKATCIQLCSGPLPASLLERL